MVSEIVHKSVSVVVFMSNSMYKIINSISNLSAVMPEKIS